MRLACKACDHDLRWQRGRGWVCPSCEPRREPGRWLRWLYGGRP